MAGGFSLDAKVFRRFNKSRAEEHSPPAIHRHAGRQRMRRLQEPLRQSQSVPRGIGRQRREHIRNPGFDRFTRLIVLPANEDLRCSGLRKLGHHHRFGDRIVHLLVKAIRFGEVGLQLPGFGID